MSLSITISCPHPRSRPPLLPPCTPPGDKWLDPGGCGSGRRRRQKWLLPGGAQEQRDHHVRGDEASRSASGDKIERAPSAVAKCAAMLQEGAAEEGTGGAAGTPHRRVQEEHA